MILPLVKLLPRNRQYQLNAPFALKCPSCVKHNASRFKRLPDEVDVCHQRLAERGVEILEPPTDQARGHRTVYFSDPEGNILEVYAEI